MKVTALQTNFTAGELSPRLYGRTDIAKYRNGAKSIENMLVSPYGGVRKRGGTRWIQNAITATFASRLVPFVYNTTQAYVVEIGGGLIRFYRNQGLLTETGQTVTNVTRANPGVVTCAGHGFANNDHVILQSIGGMTEVNNLVYRVANVTANTFELSGVNTSSFGAYTSGGTVARVVEIASPYDSADLDELTFAQSNDVLFLAHGKYPLKQLNRLSSTSFEIVDANITGGPFRPINTDRFNRLTPNVTTASTTITGATQANPVVITAAAHNLNDGDTVTISGVGGMVELNGNTYVVQNVTTNTVELYDEDGTTINGNSYTAFTSGGTIARSLSVFGTFSEGSTRVRLAAEKDTFDAAMVGMLIRIWEPGLGTGVGTVTAGASVPAFSHKTNEGNVYGVLRVNTLWHDSLRLPTHESGTVRHYRGDNASLFIDFTYLHSLYTILRIDTVTNATTVRCTVVKGHVPKSVVDFGSSYWELGAWNDYYGYPKLVTLHEQRLWAGATDTDARWLWGSRSPSFTDFSDGANDDDAVLYQLASNGADELLWMVPTNILAVGTSAGEFVATPSNRNESLTPSNARAVRQTPLGSANIQPVQINNAILYAERDGRPRNPARKIREFIYSFEQDSFRSNDMTILAEHITQTGVLELAYQQAPDSIVWARRTDGRLAAMVYEPSQEVVGWTRHTLGGFGDANGGIPVVERICVIPGTTHDELWMVVKRYINGATQRTIEVLSNGLTATQAKESAYFVDCGVTYDGAAATTITGINHLEGETLDVLADGAVRPSVLVSDGKATLATSAETIHFGYGYQGRVETLDIDAGAQQGTAQGRSKRVSRLWVRLNRSLGGRIGRGTTYEDIYYRTAEDFMDDSSGLYSGYKSVAFPAGWDGECTVKIVQDQPLPLEVLSVIPELETIG